MFIDDYVCNQTITKKKEGLKGNVVLFKEGLKGNVVLFKEGLKGNVVLFIGIS
jgi:hypothetical protein